MKKTSKKQSKNTKNEKLKIIQYDNISKEGVLLTFNKDVEMIKGARPLNEYWLSWDRIAETIEVYLKNRYNNIQ